MLRARVCVGAVWSPCMASSCEISNQPCALLPLFHPPSPLSYAARHRPATFRVDTDDWNKVYQTEGSCMDKYAVAYDRYVDEDTSCTVMLRQRTKERRENTEVQTTHRTLRRTSVTSSFPPSL